MKRNWIVFLIGFNMLLSACDKEFNIEIEYNYNNMTDHRIEFVTMGNVSIGTTLHKDTSIVHILMPDESYSFQINGLSDKTVDEVYNGILRTNSHLGDSVKVVFDSIRYLVYHKEKNWTSDALFNESAYKYNKTSNYSAILTFKFTKSDYDNAMPIE